MEAWSMIDLNAAFITLGAQVGGKDASAATANHIMDFRVLLAKECNGPHGGSLSEIALILRIDGSVQSWSRSDVSNVRIQKKARYATADIFMPSAIWKSGHSWEIREFIVSGAKVAVETILEKAHKAKLSLDYQKIIQGSQRAAKAYLAELGNSELQ
jgi:hypothetical protein